jgi:hypothetical protein
VPTSWSILTADNQPPQDVLGRAVFAHVVVASASRHLGRLLIAYPQTDRSFRLQKSIIARSVILDRKWEQTGELQMALRMKQGALKAEEKKVVKALLNKGWRNQDIQALVNIGRDATINSARITEVKKNPGQRAATDDEVEYFQIRKRSFDHQTGLNLFDHERLIRAREAMILAVQIFNSASLRFKTEVFTMLANVAWTYVLHEFYLRKGLGIVGDDGRSRLLSQMVERHDVPLSEPIKQNLRSLKILRDDVEHKLLGKGDVKWLSLFQACCLNFDRTLCALFGERLTLANDLAFALQFARLNFEQVSTLNRFEIPAEIEALDGRLRQGLSEELLDDLEFQFRVIYTLDSSSKSRAHFEFIRPNSAEGKEIRNVLVQHKLADELYPYKPMAVCGLVAERTGQPFTIRNHTQAWCHLKARPKPNAAQPANTNREFCIFHPVHGDYTYSSKWVDALAEIVNDPPRLAALRATPLG